VRGTPARRRAGEAAFDLTLLGLGIAVIAGSLNLGMGTFAQPGPGLFPLLAGVLIAAAQLVAALKLLSGENEQAEITGMGSRGTLVALIAIFAAWIVAMPVLGYIVGTFVAVIAFAKALRLEGWAKPVALAAGAAAGVYLLFERLLFLDLPTGPFG
jgi:hypothetical protein